MTHSRLIVWGVIVINIVLVTIWLYVLLRSLLPRLQVAESETRKRRELRKEIDSESVLLTVRSPWIEAYWVPFLALALFATPWLFLVRWGGLPPGYLAISIMAILSEMLIWLYCHVRRIVITESSVVLYGGFLAEDIRKIPLTDIDWIDVSKTSRFERKYGLDTIEVKSSVHPTQEIRMTRIQDASKLQAFIERLKKRADA